MSLLLKELALDDLLVLRDYLVYRKGHKLEQAKYTDGPAGKIWIFDNNHEQSYLVQDTDRAFIIPTQMEFELE